MFYHNLDPTPPQDWRAFVRWRAGRHPLPPADAFGRPAVMLNDGTALRTGHNTLTWVGHASVVVQLDGQTVLCDPVWSKLIGGVVPRLSPPGLQLRDVPPPDVILISHNHYDHLDLPTLRSLGKNTRLFVPAGLGAYCRIHGFRQVEEWRWWEQRVVGNLRITFVPAQHWSRRLPWDTNRSWWGGWVIEGSQRIYHAGDTAYFSGFGEIARRFPGLDWALLPIGAYQPQWMMQQVHMSPEEAGAAFEQLGARRMLPIHYGTFRLADEPLGEPPVRLQRWWADKALPDDRLWLPKLGETRCIDQDMVATER